MAKITFYYDVVSPFSWIGFETVLRYKPIWNIDVQFVPFFLGGVMQLSQNKPPATNPNKGMHLFRQDIPALSKLYQMNLAPPPEFPQSSLKCQRILTVLRLQQDPAKVEQASRQFWKLYWQDGESMKDDATLIKYLASVLPAPGMAESYVNEECNKQEIKDELMRVTKMCVEELGAFGAPFLVIENDKGESINVFGSDRMEVVAMHLGKPYLGAVPNKNKL